MPVARNVSGEYKPIDASVQARAGIFVGYATAPVLARDRSALDIIFLSHNIALRAC